MRRGRIHGQDLPAGQLRAYWSVLTGFADAFKDRQTVSADFFRIRRSGNLGNGVERRSNVIVSKKTKEVALWAPKNCQYLFRFCAGGSDRQCPRWVHRLELWPKTCSSLRLDVKGQKGGLFAMQAG